MPWIPTKEGDRMEDLLTIRDLSISYEKHVTVDHVSLSLKPGEALSVVGESGCGKSTILRALMHVLPDNGKIEGGSLLYRGKDIYRLSPEEWRQVTGRRMVMLFQQPGSYLDPIRTIGKQFNDFLRAHGVSSVDCRPLALGILERAGLPEGERILSSYAFQLSGGMRQKVAASMILALSPELIVMDEPITNLDAKLRTSMRTEIIKLHKKLATTFIYVTHDQTEAMTMGDRIVVMKDGIIQQVDTPQNLYDMPCNMFVAGFIGSPQMNFLDGTLIKKGELYGIDLGGDVIPLPKEKTADGKLDAYVGKKVKMGIRPEDIDDEPEFMAKHTDCQLDAKVDVSEMMGAEIYLYLEYKGNKMTARVAPTSKARNGDTVRVAFDPHKVHLFDIETEQTILN